MKRNQADCPVATLCRLLGVSTSGYYAWLNRPASARAQSDARLSERIRALHQRSRGRYGVPRILEDLQEEGERVNHKRVARLMRSAGLVTQRVQDHRAGSRCTASTRSGAAVFHSRPARPAVGGGPHLRSHPGRLSVPGGGHGRVQPPHRGLGHGDPPAQLILDALNMAIYQRRPRDVIHHSDQGTQYTSIAFGARCKEAGIRPSMGSVGDCFDNAMCESFFATLECELLDRRRFKTQAEAKMVIFEFIEGWYNPHRRHSSIGYLSPVNYERRICPILNPQPPPMHGLNPKP